MYLVTMEWIDSWAREEICNTDSLAVAKAVYRHYVKKTWYNPIINIGLYECDGCEIITCLSDDWKYEFCSEQENWFKRKGLDYWWWIQFDEIRNI